MKLLLKSKKIKGVDYGEIYFLDNINGELAVGAENCFFIDEEKIQNFTECKFIYSKYGKILIY